MTPTPVFFDTDIGDDVDDLLALAIACASPEIELHGVGTVFGPTERRARFAQHVLAVLGVDAPVYAGLSEPLTPPDRLPEFAETIGRRFDPNEGIKLHTELIAVPFLVPPIPEIPAPEALAEFWRQTGSQGRTVAIGPLTNIAKALAISGETPNLTVMAGQFVGENWAEWNVKCDPDAAQAVFESDCEIDVIPHAIGVELSFTSDETATFTGLGTPMASFFRDAINVWQGQGFHFHVWDLLAVMAACEPALFGWRQGFVRIDTDAGRYGFSSLEESFYGPHRIAFDTERDQAVGLMLDRLVSAATNCTRAPEGH